jgi:hypothetical protein
MSGREVILALDEFCIENSARREHRRLTRRLLENGVPDPDEEAALKLLTAFLAQEDFSALRAADPELAGGHPVMVRLYYGPHNRVCWEKTENRGG